MTQLGTGFTESTEKNTSKSLDSSSDSLKNRIARPALFLDRDGVINADHGYVHRKESIEWIKGIFDLVRWANQKSWWVVVVTNQSGIGRGLYDEADFHYLTDWMHAQFQQRQAKIDAVYHCPHHPSQAKATYQIDCNCRKPKPGMLLRAAHDLTIDLPQSVLVGDNLSDMQAGKSAGLNQLFLLKNPDAATKKTTQKLDSTDEIFDNFQEFDSLDSILKALKQLLKSDHH